MPPDITAIKNARSAKVRAIDSWARGIEQRFKRATFKYIGKKIAVPFFHLVWLF
jgi:hypothetical protein